MSVELAVTVNVAVVAPESTVTELGTVATFVFDEVRVTVVLLTAATDKVTVPVEVDPTAILLGFKAIFVSAGC